VLRKYAQQAGLPLTVAICISGTAIAADAPGVGLELNKLEQTDKGCRTSLVVNNTGEHTYQSYKTDLFLFQPDGVIGKRVTVDLAPIKPQKKTVKIFDIDGFNCDKIGSVLVNEIMDCRTEAGAQTDCMEHLTTTSLANVKISK
jgi:hypothetical protein